ncbi:MAG: alpha-mannosidase [Clostridiales bacterium]|nr:alpha-mannosidase [Clostridiales bacterium]
MISNEQQLCSRVKQITKNIFSQIIVKNEKIDGFLYKECEYVKLLCNVPNSLDGFLPFEETSCWGGKCDSHFWFYNEIDVPSVSENEKVELLLQFYPKIEVATQYMVYIDGKFLRCIDNEHPSVELPEGKHTLFIYAYTGMDNAKKINFEASLITVNEEVKKLYYHLFTPLGVLDVADKHDNKYFELLEILNNTLNLVELDVDRDTFYRSVKIANTYIEEKLYNQPILSLAEEPYVSCESHTHIDIGWLWTVDQTEEKAVRSFSNVLYNMEKYEGYSFMSSQPILYYFVKKHMPELYEKVKEKVKEGRWIPEGAAWVEADCNLTSGESLVRQILYGKRFFKEEFGVDNRIFWLPDVFGYSFALPQILKKCGVDTFVTTKISWNDTNTMPHDTFTWRGLDGSEVLAYFITGQNYKETYPGPELDPQRLTTYVGNGTPRYIKGTYERYSNKNLNNNVLFLYGWGDGGGGSTESDFEVIQRLKNGMGDVLPARFDGVTEYFNRLHEKCRGNKNLPIWDNELYLEFHRGTYTSVARIKKNNRRAEFAMQNLENLFAFNAESVFENYPKELLDNTWRTILTNQFHDILPGSAIKEVYDRTDREYAEIFAMVEEQSNTQIQLLKEKLSVKDGYLVVNTNSFGGNYTLESDGVFYDFEEVPAKGYATLFPKAFNGSVFVSERLIENDYFVVEFDEQYEISRLYDKKNKREVLLTGKTANVIRIYDDYPPVVYDAWDIRDYYDEKYVDLQEVVSVTPIFRGAKSGLEIIKKYRNSTFVQTIYLYENNDRIDFDTKVDWHEKHRFVKALFPIDVNTTKSTFDIQFGNTERNSINGNSWDRAKFEVCGNKFGDLSEGDYGVSLLNDCKYGYSVENGVIGLSLIKCSDYPSVDADEGEHTFVYSLYPHKGDCRHSGVYKQAFALNNPPFVVKLSDSEPIEKIKYSMLNCDKENVIIETVKKAEAENAIIVRCYEIMNRRVNTNIFVGFDFKEAYECDMLENNEKKLGKGTNVLVLEFKPFEIKTLKFVLDK